MLLDHIVINASDVEESARYYGALLPMLGFLKTRDFVWGNKAGLVIDLRRAEEPDKAYHRFGPGVNHLGFTAPDRQAVDAIRSAMKAKGFAVPDCQILDGDYCLFMKDHDGFRLEITAYAAR